MRTPAKYLTNWKAVTRSFPVNKKDVIERAKVLGATFHEDEEGVVVPSSPELTAWYVGLFCNANNLKKTS